MEYTRIKNTREDNELTQVQVATHLNIAQRTYSGYETGTRNMPIQCLVRLAKYYKTSTDYLLGLTDEKRPYPPVKSKLKETHAKKNLL